MERDLSSLTLNDPRMSWRRRCYMQFSSRLTNKPRDSKPHTWHDKNMMKSLTSSAKRKKTAEGEEPQRLMVCMRAKHWKETKVVLPEMRENSLWKPKKPSFEA
jgi:hypothetical protein